MKTGWTKAFDLLKEISNQRQLLLECWEGLVRLKESLVNKTCVAFTFQLAISSLLTGPHVQVVCFFFPEWSSSQFIAILCVLLEPVCSLYNPFQ